jgi:alkanesulfonate monooxygenase SsuD/methylene tetrahydromethanopterin reductase-like flavin-dependent oxidoreductase (luciferase family)
VTALAHTSVPFRFAAESADVVFLTPQSIDEIPVILDEVRGGQESPPHTFGDLVVFLDETAAAAADRKARLDERAGAGFTSDAAVFTGTPAALADQLLAWHDAGLSGFRLRPGALPHDLTAITRGLVPELRSRGAFRSAYEASTLRGLLGLGRPANRYVA